MESAMSSAAIRARDLRKSFGDKVVLDGIDLEVPAGTVFALLGPNGSGKTTTVQILSTLISRDAGSAWIAGHDLSANPDGVRASIGVTGQFSAVDNLLTGRENLLLMGDLLHLSKQNSKGRAEELLSQFDLIEAGGKPVATYSGGMRRRLDLAMTLMGSPGLIFLDEPTTGLDPRSRRGLWEIVRDLVAQGVTIFLTTQYLEEADQLADYIAILDGGKLVAQGTPAELKRQVPGGHVRLQFADMATLDAASRAIGSAKRDEEALTLRVPGDGAISSLRSLLAEIERADIEVESLSVHAPDLDDVFLSLTGHARTA